MGRRTAAAAERGGHPGGWRRLLNITVKIEMPSGHHQCFYFVLTEGYQLTIFAGTESPDENKMHIIMTNTDETFLQRYSDKYTVSFVYNVTVSDTYEVCLLNSVGYRSVIFSATYYQPYRHEAEMAHALHKYSVVTNMSEATAKYIGGIEVNIGKVLSSIRNKPSLRRDYLILRDSNANVQWKSIIFIVLMMCSFGGTTMFIHYLFHVPVGKVSI